MFACYEQLHTSAVHKDVQHQGCPVPARPTCLEGCSGLISWAAANVRPELLYRHQGKQHTASFQAVQSCSSPCIAPLSVPPTPSPPSPCAHSTQTAPPSLSGGCGADQSKGMSQGVAWEGRWGTPHQSQLSWQASPSTHAVVVAGMNAITDHAGH